MEKASASQPDNKALVQASFERWKNDSGGPSELPAPDAEWTIVGLSPLSKTYQSKQEFLSIKYEQALPALIGVSPGHNCEQLPAGVHEVEREPCTAETCNSRSSIAESSQSRGVHIL